MNASNFFYNYKILLNNENKFYKYIISFMIYFKYFSCNDGFYDDGVNADCVQCDIKCRTCNDDTKCSSCYKNMEWSDTENDCL